MESMDHNFTITSEQLDTTQKLVSLAKNLSVLILPSSLWATHVDPNYEYIAILHTELINYSKLAIDKGILITYDQDYHCLNTSVFIQNEAVSLPIFQYTVRTLSDLTHMLYSLEQLILCKNSDQKLENCLRYLKPDEFEKLCTNCRIQDDCFYGVENSLSDQNFVDENVSDICDKDENHDKTEFICSICNAVSTHRSSHYKHVANHSESNMILCNICGKTFCKTYGLENHLLTHSQVKPYECKICFKTYSSKKNLRIHSEIHQGNRPYSCKICNKTFTTPSNLSTHIKSLHNKKKPHACVMCGMSFLYPQLLKIHMRKHTGERPYQCSICGKSFALNVHLTIHTRTHTGERPFICSICGKGFTTTGNLSSHKKVHSK